MRGSHREFLVPVAKTAVYTYVSYALKIKILSLLFIISHNKKILLVVIKTSRIYSITHEYPIIKNLISNNRDRIKYYVQPVYGYLLN